MLIAVERLLIKLRQPASRAAELIELRRRLRAERITDETEHALAAEVQTAKLAVVRALTEVTSCASCAVGQPWPNGHYSGGDCCCGVTNDVFDDHEVAALAHAGTRARDLVVAKGDHAGCSFRGERGCSLEVEHRPARCVHYVCDTLRHELHDRGELDHVEVKLRALNEAMQQFKTARLERIDREVATEIIDAITYAREDAIVLQTRGGSPSRTRST